MFTEARGLIGVTYTSALAPGYDYVGELVAFDAVTGTRAWEYRPASGAPMTASALATAGGVVFGGTADRQYTAAQAARGAEVFARECSACHQASIYTGQNFSAKWSRQTLADVYQQVSLAMPPANPGGLPAASYASIVAFFLSRSANPDGEQPLAADLAVLRTIGVR